MTANKLKNQVKPGNIPEKDVIFALDIGTRSIIGIVAHYENEILKVLDVEVCEHTKRAMIDGQIEDVDLVAGVVAQVKRNLEKRMGKTFSKVHVAAAGRALKTVPTSVLRQLDKDSFIGSQLVAKLESDALMQAQEELLAQPGMLYEADFFCVGYSIVKCYLDDYPISTLLNHKGKTAQMDIIATFLPVQVVDSLTLCMKKNKLQIASLTLEPIAAMNAVIPQELRIINLAIVDIGAGTSDIAISNDGSVVAYTMATVAGDEITEAIVKNLLVDFNTAERVKSELSIANHSVEYTNILGMTMQTPVADILNAIDSDIDALCEEIAKRILDTNGGAPAAVFVVGGGSKMPHVCEKIANKLQLDPTKVVVSSNNYMKRVIATCEDIASPEFVTPVGIALTAALLLKNGVHITVNGQDAAVLKHGSLSVMDALQVSGYDTHHLMGRSGKSVTFELNGQKKIIRGGHPTPAEIYVNGIAASISTPLSAGDDVKIIPCTHGEDAKPIAAEILKGKTAFSVCLNGKEVNVGIRVWINGKSAAPDHPICDQDVVDTDEIRTLYELLESQQLDASKIQCMIQNKEIHREYRLKPGDDIQFTERSILPTLDSQSKEARLEQDMNSMQQTFYEVESAGACETAVAEKQEDVQSLKHAIQVTINRRLVRLEPKEDQSLYCFLDMLNYVDMDPSKPQGNYIMKLNHRDASFLDVVSDGDLIEIQWENTMV